MIHPDEVLDINDVVRSPKSTINIGAGSTDLAAISGLQPQVGSRIKTLRVRSLLRAQNTVFYDTWMSCSETLLVSRNTLSKIHVF
jgi:hypothetical protein